MPSRRSGLLPMCSRHCWSGRSNRQQSCKPCRQPELKAMLQQLVEQVVVEPDRLQLSIRRNGVLTVLGLRLRRMLPIRK